MLPKIDLPKYTTILPLSNETVVYRPYTVKEENILKYAAQSGEDSDYEDAVKQIIENCTDIKLDNIAPVDFEWIFLKVHAASNSNIVEVTYNIDECEHKECPRQIPGYFDINCIEINKESTLNCPFKQRGQNYIIPITETVGMQLKKVAVAYEDDYQTLYSSLISIYDEDKLYPKSAIPFNEFSEFIDNIPKKVALDIKEFFTYSGANIKCEVIGDCPKCGKRFTQTVEGLKDFFD